uniref:C2H2-type domain-containing protein n=1 Tax=Pinctada imbricata TaxID=66713 RepID=A0AA88YCW0_PINIB|nr:hypothetical protein FSP39_015243 [Pinctada imbricata]
MENKVKVKQEPVDYAEHVQSLLANAKSAYNNRFDAEIAGEAPNGYKRKLISDINDNRYGKKMRLLDADEQDKAERYETRLSSRSGGQIKNGSDTPNLPCLLCDEEFKSENERMLHVTLVHKSKSNANKRTGMRIARHTCQICFARFRTLRDFFTHTAGHAQDPGLSTMQRDISDKLAKNTLQQFLMNSVSSAGRDMLHPTFKCDCCDAIFTNRDSYAMHVMMRVKDDCTNSVNSAKKSNIWLDSTDSYSGSTSKPASNSPTKTDHMTGQDLNQAYYIDVTNLADKDEYLQSVLDTTNHKEKPENELNTSYGKKKCAICSKAFADQDSLAMHVMSNHAEEIPSTTTEACKPIVTSEQKVNKQNYSIMYMHNFPSLTSRKGPLNVHGELLYCEYCGGIFTSRDSLAMHMLTHTAAEMRKNSVKIPVENIAYQSKAVLLNHSMNLQEGRKLSVESTNEKATKIVSTARSSQEHNGDSAMENGHSSSFDFGNWKRDAEKYQDIQKQSQSQMVNNRNENVFIHREQIPESYSPDDHKETKSQGRRMYRSLSLPDMSRIHSADIPRPRSTSNIGNENYVYILNDSLLDDNGDYGTTESRTGSNLTIKKSEQSAQPKADVTTEVQRNKSSETVATSADEVSDPYQFIHGLNRPIYVCKYCEIIFLNRTLYYLHKGLHNVNNPWQCNMCGKVCSNVHDFSAHVIHL